jgi:MOSC domain-containing protein YiiM
MTEAGESIGVLGGIARHGRPRGPIEILDNVSVTVVSGLQGDFRGAVKPGGKARRQVSLITAEAWAAAMAELGLHDEELLPWHARRANLLVQGLKLPQHAGYVLAIGISLRIEVMQECDPCSRMEQLVPGLKAALLPDWRGGVLGKVLTDGPIAVGDMIRIET